MSPNAPFACTLHLGGRQKPRKGETVRRAGSCDRRWERPTSVNATSAFAFYLGALSREPDLPSVVNPEMGRNVQDEARHHDRRA
jgi:hypothetical protein